MRKENISDAVIRRLPRYYRQLTDLCNRGVVRISSHSLGQEMNITASQIRQDFSCFGEFGQQGYGYNVEELRAEIGHILGVDNNHHLIMIGVGNLGHALLQNFPFSQSGFTVDAAFDVSPAVIGTVVNNVPVYAMSELDHFLQDHPVDVVVLTSPWPRTPPATSSIWASRAFGTLPTLSSAVSSRMCSLRTFTSQTAS